MSLLALLSTGGTGCIVGVTGGKHFTYRGTADIPEDALRLDGYYYREEDGQDWARNGTTVLPLVLWEDGTVAKMSLHVGKILSSSSDPFSIQYGTLQEALETFEERADSLLDRGKSYTVSWGGFRVRGDSISIQVVTWAGSGSPFRYDPIQIDGVILNDTTFVLAETTLFTGHDAGTYPVRGDTLRFKQFDAKPSAENWTQTHRKLR